MTPIKSTAGLNLRYAKCQSCLAFCVKAKTCLSAPRVCTKLVSKSCVLFLEKSPISPIGMNGKRGSRALMRMCRPREAFRRSIRRNEGNGKDCEPMMRTSLLFSMLVAGGLFLALAAWADDKKGDAKGDDLFVTEAAVR